MLDVGNGLGQVPWPHWHAFWIGYPSDCKHFGSRDNHACSNVDGIYSAHSCIQTLLFFSAPLPCNVENKFVFFLMLFWARVLGLRNDVQHCILGEEIPSTVRTSMFKIIVWKVWDMDQHKKSKSMTQDLRFAVVYCSFENGIFSEGQLHASLYLWDGAHGRTGHWRANTMGPRHFTSTCCQWETDT